jgi:hypothetical protein
MSSLPFETLMEAPGILFGDYTKAIPGNALESARIAVGYPCR